MPQLVTVTQNNVQRSFRRKEKKYILTAAQLDAFMNSMAGRISEDGFGRTAVLSLYYDTEGFELLGRSVDKPRYKEKFRIRSYGVPDDSSMVFAEIKKKLNGVVYKRRVEGTYQEILDLLENDAMLDHDIQIQREILWMKDRWSLRPAVVVGYDRTAYVCPSDPGLRVTVDSDIRYRLDGLDLRLGDAGKLLRDPDFRIMEVKAQGSVPMWFAQCLSENRIYPGSFSKVGTVYKEAIIPEIISDRNR